MKTPDEIKKGLECCITDNCKECPYYPLYEVFGCKLARAKDALALIQQLEAERDAAVADLAHVKDCDTCKYDDACLTGKKDCFGCHEKSCPCLTCKYEWRGVQKEE